MGLAEVTSFTGIGILKVFSLPHHLIKFGMQQGALILVMKKSERHKDNMYIYT